MTSPTVNGVRGEARSRLAAPRWSLLTMALAVLGALVVLAVVLWGAGFDVGRAGAAAWRGTFGSADAFVSSTLVRATPLLFCSLAVSIAFRAGVLNIGADGQLLAGATAASVVLLAHPVPVLTPVLALLAATTAGSLAAAVPAVLRRHFGVLEVISTIMVNFLALHAVGFLVRGPMQEPTGVFPQSATFAEEVRLPLLVPGSRLHVGYALGILLAATLWFHFTFTASGFRSRVVGAGATAAASAGLVDVGRVTFRAFLLSGAMAGLAGGVEVAGVTYALYETISPGYGYTAIAVALMAGLHPLGVVASSVFFGSLAAAGSAMQRGAGVPSVAVAIIEATVILAVVAVNAAARYNPRNRWRW